jgi:hypothetical protein
MEPAVISPTPEQLRLLDAGPGRVTRRAPQWVFSSLEEFVEVANNFYLAFLIMDSMPDGFKDIYRKRPAFRRFAILFPEQLAELEALLEETGRKMGADNAARLYEAYQLMVRLVDRDDRGIYAPISWPSSQYIDEGQGFDLLYLCR